MVTQGLLQPGTMLGNILIERQYGSDAMGELYTAVIQPVGMRAQVRVLSPQLSTGGPMLQQLLAKLESYATCKSPHLAQMVAFNQMATIQRWLIVSAIGNATTLAERVQQKNLTPPAVVAIMKQALTGIQHAHEKNLLHDDITLENIVITADGKVKIMNFAFAGVSVEDRIARPEYQAPELLKSGVLNVSTDIFSLGITFHKLFQSLGIALFPTEIRRVAERMYTQESANRFRTATEALAMLGGGASKDALEDASQIITRSFERTKTIQLQVDSEIRSANFRGRMPKAVTLVILALIAYLGVTKLGPFWKGKNIMEASSALLAQASKKTKSFTGIERAEMAKNLAVETKKAAEDDTKRKMASAEAAADGDAQH